MSTFAELTTVELFGHNQSTPYIEYPRELPEGEVRWRMECYVSDDMEYISLTLHTYRVLTKTPSGAWIDVPSGMKFVLDGGRHGKRWAHEYPTWAIESCLARRHWAYRYAMVALDRHQAVINALEGLGK